MTSLIDFDAIAAATCQVTYSVVGTTMHWTLTGPDEAVKEKVNQLFRRYPVQGYGTCVERVGEEMRITAYSCD